MDFNVYEVGGEVENVIVEEVFPKECQAPMIGPVLRLRRAVVGDQKEPLFQPT